MYTLFEKLREDLSEMNGTCYMKQFMQRPYFSLKEKFKGYNKNQTNVTSVTVSALHY